MPRSKLSKARKEELARFAEFVYRRALDLDLPLSVPNTDDVVRSLTTIRAGARSLHYDVTGEWLNGKGSVADAP